VNIKDFEKDIQQKILSRGREYFNDGNVISLDYDDDNDEWTAEVSGSDDYTVTVKLRKTGEIPKTFCDCPYDLGEYCKHQVAVFYSLRKLLAAGTKTNAKKSPKIKFEDMLNKIEKEKLIAFLMDFSAENKKFKTEFMLRFSDEFLDKSDVLAYARNLIKSSFKGFVHSGYIEYYDAPKVIKGAEKVLAIAEAEDNQCTAVSLCIVILEEMLAAEADYNSEGYCYGIAEQATELIGDIVSSFAEDTDELKQIFAILMLYVSDDKNQDFTEFGFDILETFIPLCNIKYIREGVEKFIKIIESKSDSKYYKSNLQNLRYGIISKFDDKKEAREFIENNLENDNFRKMAIEYALKEKDYDKAVKLCLERNNTGRIYQGLTEWRELLYNIYEKSGNKDAQKKLAYEFTIGDNNNSFEYYLELKTLYADNSDKTDEWYQVFDNILSAVNVPPYSKSVYTKILIHENMKPELLEYCKIRKNFITEYYKYLLPDYKDEVTEIYTDYIKERAVKAFDRSGYKAVCDLIKDYAKICGKKNAGEITQELRKNHVRQPAFIDELSKMK